MLFLGSRWGLDRVDGGGLDDISYIYGRWCVAECRGETARCLSHQGTTGIVIIHNAPLGVTVESAEWVLRMRQFPQKVQ